MHKSAIVSLFVILFVMLLTSVYYVGQGVIEKQIAAVSATVTTMSKSQAESEVRSIYSVCLGRTPDSGGLKHYTDRLMNGESVSRIKSDICNSPEAEKYNQKNSSNKNTTTSSKTSSNSSYEQQIANVYRICLKREPDASGLKTYTDLLKNGKSINDVANIVCSSPEAKKVGTSQYDINAVKNLFSSNNKDSSTKDQLLKLGLITSAAGAVPILANTVGQPALVAPAVPLGIITGTGYLIKKVFGW